ncbi:MAG: hypothetical protein K2X27_23065 [Candidatus Obscuribacterales bacterium]|nr:hypothetical protein [Candidatus Obscuribacterales bacterium]
MKLSKHIWNRLIAALSGILFLFVLAPRHDCLCATIKNEADAHACCRSKTESAEAEEHACCKSENLPGKAQILLGSLVQNSMSCCCSIDQAAASVNQSAKIVPEHEPLLLSLAGTAIDAPGAPDERLELRKIELQNDELKPSKIFLLKRALLN